MAKVVRYSGQVRVELKYDDRADVYRAKVCSPRRCQKVRVGAPRSKRVAVDSMRAYHDAAHAAISFSRDEIQDYASTNSRGSGWQIRRAKRKR